MPATYWVDLQSLGALLVVRVNGIEVAASWDALPRVTSLDFSHAALRGENHFEILVAPEAHDPEGQIALYGIPERHEKGDFDRFFEWILHENEVAPASPDGLERVLDQRFLFRDAPEAWAFSRGRPYDRVTDSAALLERVAEHHRDFAARNLRPLFAASRIAIEERAAALHVSTDVLGEQWLAQLSEAFVDDTFRAEPLELERLVLEPALGGRLVHVRTPSGRHPLQGKRGAEAERSVTLPLSFSHLDGRWEVVR